MADDRPAPDGERPGEPLPAAPLPSRGRQRLDLAPLPYHKEVVRHLQRHAKSVWAHYRAPARDPEMAEAQRLHLLKTTVVLKRESHDALYAVADDVAHAVGLDVPVELYQGPDTGGLNAALLFVPDRARVVLYGPIQERLDGDALRALFGHELAHHRLWSLENGVYLAAWQALQGMHGMAPLASVENTLRLYSLSTEVFADRAGLEVAGLEATLRCLTTTRTGLSNVKPLDFLEQSRELFAAEGTGSRDWSHPEAHIRALALDWYDSGRVASDENVRSLLEGPLQLDDLDLVRREALATLTERMVGSLLQPRWFRTETVVGHARLMFDDYEVPDQAELTPEDAKLGPWGDSVRQYLAYVLTDFVVVDTDLEDLPFLQAHSVAQDLGLTALFERAVNRELRKTRKAIKALVDARDERLEAAAARGNA